MRRLGISPSLRDVPAFAAAAAAACVGIVAVAGPATAQDGEAAAGEEVCPIADPRLVEMSSLVAIDEGYIVINDGTDAADREGIFFLDSGCQVVDQILYPTPPYDPEDAALDRENNVLWVGDIGDNAAEGTADGDPRVTVAFWRVDLAGDRVPVIYRFAYPNGEPRNAEALVLNGDGTPIIVSRGIGTAELFVPAQEPQPNNPPEAAVPLESVGELTVPESETEHPLGQPAGQVITGGANAPDGSRVVLRTYTDALEFDVSDGDVVAAITGGQPRVTPLPGEPLGEAISYTLDGERFITVSEVPADQQDFTPAILSYAPSQPAPPASEAQNQPADSGGGGGGGLSLPDIVKLVAAVGVLGILLVAAGVFGIVRARRRWPGKGGNGGGDGPDGPVVGRARLTGDGAREQQGVYASSAAREGEYGTEPHHGNEYPGTQYQETEYRGAPYGGNEYQGTEYGGGQEYRGAGYGGGHGEHGYADEGYGDPGYRDGGYGGERAPYRDGNGGYGPGDGYRQQAAGYGPGGQSDQPFDQDWGNGGRGEVGGGYREAPPAGYPPGGYQEQPPAGYPPEGYPRSGRPPDSYPEDDPDYSYEFRDQGRW
jgi:hypothetical protein